MSVINQALKDLQQRQQQGSGRAKSVYQPPQRARWPLWFALGAGVLTGSAVMYYMLAHAQSDTGSTVSGGAPGPVPMEPQLAIPSADSIQPITEAKAPEANVLDDRMPVAQVTPPSASQPAATTEQPQAEVAEIVAQSLELMALPRADEEARSASTVEENSERGSMRIERVERSAPELAQQRLEQAIAAQDSGNPRRAETLLQEALVLRPDFIEARQRLAAYYYGRGFSGQALRTIEDGLLHSPGHPRLLSLAARIHEEAGEPEAALNMLNRLNASLPEDSDVVVLRAAMANEVSRYDVAAEDYRALLQQNPNRGLWWLGLGFAEEGLDNVEAAQQAYQRALEDTGLNRESREFARSRMEALSRW